MIKTALSQIEEFLPLLESGNYIKFKQDDTKGILQAVKRWLIDWRMTANSIHNMVRALTKPYGGAEFNYNENIYKLWKTELIFVDSDNIEPGKVISIDNSYLPTVKCGEFAIKLVETEPKFRLQKECTYENINSCSSSR